MRRTINLTLTITILFLALGVIMEPVPGNAQTVETSADLAGAVEALKRGNYGTAEEVLSDYPEDGPLGSYSRYLLARTYLGLGDLGGALNLLEEVEAGGPEEVLEFERYYLEAEILHELGRNERAGEVAGNASDFVETAREEKKLLELRFSIARERERLRQALQLSISLMETANLRFIGRERDRIFDRTEEIIDRLELSDLESQRHFLAFIETLVRYREYRRARGLLLRYIGDLSRELKPGAYFRLAWLDGVKLDFPEEALWTFQRLFRTAPSRSMEAKGRYYFALTKNGVEDDYNLTNNLLEVHERFPDTYFGKLAARRAFEEETEDADLTTLDRALERYRSRLSREAVRSATWRLFFKSYKAGSYKTALDYLGLLESYYENVPPKFLFWRRKARIASPDVEPGSYLRVMTFQENHPTDYYSLLAGQKGWSRDNFRVSETWSSREIGPAQVEQRVLEGDIPTSTLAQFELAISLEEHGLVTLALNRLERLAASIPKEDYLYLKFQWERSAGNYRESLKTAVELMGWYYDNNRRPPVEVVKAAYPTYFSDAVERVAGKFGLPEELIYGVIRQESAFDRDAYSTAKAGGLMQVIPSTARGIANDLGDTDFQFDDLFDPQTAVEFGSYYVNKQVSGSGNIRLGLVAYHGGPGNLSRWREDIGVGDVDLFLERIPQGSTENYVKAVYRNYLVYRQLY